MKKVLLLTIVFFVTFCLSAQSVQEGKTEFNKTQVDAFIVNVPNFPVNIVEDAIYQKYVILENMRIDKQSGYRAFLSQQIARISTQNIDLFFKVQEVGKKKERQTQIVCLVSTGNANFISSAIDATVAANVKNELTTLVKYVGEYEASQRVLSNTNALNKLQKEVKSLNLDKDKLQKEMNAIDQKIADKNLEINKIQAEIDKANQDMKAFQ